MSKYIKLSDSQKDEIRRLTQLANRRIRNAMKVYEKAGKSVLPSEIAGRHQIKEQWATDKNPISRSVKFTSQKEYRKQLHYLRQFEHRFRMGIKEYTQVQADKTIQAIETSMERNVPDDLYKKLQKMTAPQLADFWNTFTNKARKLGTQYSSNEAMRQALNELFPEDLEALVA